MEIVELRLARGGRTVGVTVLAIIFVEHIVVLMEYGWKLGTCLRLRCQSRYLSLHSFCLRLRAASRFRRVCSMWYGVFGVVGRCVYTIVLPTRPLTPTWNWSIELTA